MAMVITSSERNTTDKSLLFRDGVRTRIVESLRGAGPEGQDLSAATGAMGGFGVAMPAREKGFDRRRGVMIPIPACTYDRGVDLICSGRGYISRREQAMAQKVSVGIMEQAVMRQKSISGEEEAEIKNVLEHVTHFEGKHFGTLALLKERVKKLADGMPLLLHAQ